MVRGFLHDHKVSRSVDDIRVDGVIRAPNGASCFVPDHPPHNVIAISLNMDHHGIMNMAGHQNPNPP